MSFGPDHHVRINHLIQNPPFCDLSDRAFRVYFDSLVFISMLRKTDPFIFDVQIPRVLWRRRKARTELIDAGLWVEAHDRPGIYVAMIDAHLNTVASIKVGRVDPYLSRVKIPDPIQDEVYRRDGHQCQICHARENLSLDHLVPHSHDGEDTVENLRVLCRSCNSRRGAGRWTDDELREMVANGA